MFSKLIIKKINAKITKICISLSGLHSRNEFIEHIWPLLCVNAIHALMTTIHRHVSHTIYVDDIGTPMRTHNNNYNYNSYYYFTLVSEMDGV